MFYMQCKQIMEKLAKERIKYCIRGYGDANINVLSDGIDTMEIAKSFN